MPVVAVRTSHQSSFPGASSPRAALDQRAQIFRVRAATSETSALTQRKSLLHQGSPAPRAPRRASSASGSLVAREAARPVAQLHVVNHRTSMPSRRRSDAARRAPRAAGRRRDGVDLGIVGRRRLSRATAVRPRRDAAAPGRPPRRAPISARQAQRSSPTGSVSSRSPVANPRPRCPPGRAPVRDPRVSAPAARHVGGRRMGQAERDPALPARPSSSASPARSGAGSPAASASAAAALRASRSARAGSAPSAARRYDQRHAVARLRVDDGDTARARVCQQSPAVVAQRFQHDRAPLRGPEQRECSRIHRWRSGARTRA